MNKSSTTSTSRRTAYERYKETTRGFRDGLANLIPSSSKIRLVSVDDLAKAVDYISNQSKKQNVVLTIDKSLLDNLEESIQLREAVVATYEDVPQDDGHVYMISILKYCHEVLLQCRRRFKKNRALLKAKAPAIIDTNKEEKTESLPSAWYSSIGQFDALQIESDTEDEYGDVSSSSDDQELDIRLEKNPTKEYSIENDLIKGSKAFQVYLFFLSAEKLFSLVTDACKALNDGMTNLQSSGESFEYVNHHTTLLILQTTATINLAIEQMRYLEETFFFEQEVLRNMYQVIALLMFPKPIHQIQTILHMYPLFIGIEIAGFCVQHSFLGTNVSISDKVERLLDYFDVDQSKRKQIESICHTISPLADPDNEVHRDGVDKLMPSKENAVLKYQKSDTNLQWHHVGRLGGRMQILYTLAQVERIENELCNEDDETLTNYCVEAAHTRCFANQVEDMLYWKKLVLVLNYHQEMKSFQNFTHLKDNQFSLCTLLLNTCIDAGEITSALSFHALVYGTSVLKAANNYKRSNVISRLTYRKFCNQQDEVRGYSFCSTMGRVLNTKERRKDHPLLDMAFGHPLLGGNILLLYTFYFNMENGFLASDINMQTLTALHLYNALRQRNILSKIDLLDMLGRALNKSSVVWPTGKPEVGGFLGSIFRAWGAPLRVLEQCVSFLEIRDFETIILNAKPTNIRKEILPMIRHLDKWQQTSIIRVVLLVTMWKKHFNIKNFLASTSNVSTAFRCIKYHDFKCPNGELHCKNNCHDVFVQQADILNGAIRSEHELLSFNWFKVAMVLDSFVVGLFEALGINSLIVVFMKVYKYPQSRIKTADQEIQFGRYVCLKFLADLVFRELDYEPNIDLCVNSAKAAEFMEDFFTNVTKKNDLTFF